MKKLLAVLFALVLAFAAVGRPALADHPGEGGAPLVATLTPEAEVPGPGLSGAEGTANLRLNPGQEEICFDIATTGLEGLTFVGAHIHPGSVTESNPPQVTLLQRGANISAASDCVFAPRAVIKEMIQNPENYYINAHALPGFGSGAIRGQLQRPGNS